MCSSGDILWNLVSALRLFSLISPLKSLVPVKGKSLVLGYLTIDPVPLLNSLFQNKGVGMAMIRLAAGLPGAAMLCPLVIALLVRCWTRRASLVPTLWCFDICSFPGISVSLSSCPFLLFSLLLSYPTHFAVNKIWKHIYLPWITPQTIKKIHFRMMACQAEWMYSKINCSTN